MPTDVPPLPFAGIIDIVTYFFLEPASGVVFAVRVGKAIFVLGALALAVGQIFDLVVGISAHIRAGEIGLVPSGTLSSLNLGASGFTLAAYKPKSILGGIHGAPSRPRKQPASAEMQRIFFSFAHSIMLLSCFAFCAN